MTAITIANTKVSTFADLGTIPTADLLAYHNKITGKDTKKFASRTKALQQVWPLVETELAQAEALSNEEEKTEEAPKPTKSPLKTRVDDLLALLSAGPKTVSEIAAGLELPTEKKARSIIDAARRAGHKVACVGRNTFGLTADGEK